MPSATTSPQSYRIRPLLLVFLLVLSLILVLWLHQSRTPQHSHLSDSPETHPQYPVDKVASVPGSFPNPVKLEVQPTTIKAETIIPYGSGEGQIGIIRGAEGQPVSGPESFAIGGDGSIYLADALNHRVLVYSNSGELLRSIRISGIGLADLTVDGKGNLYVYVDAE